MYVNFVLCFFYIRVLKIWSAHSNLELGERTTYPFTSRLLFLRESRFLTIHYQTRSVYPCRVMVLCPITSASSPIRCFFPYSPEEHRRSNSRHMLFPQTSERFETYVNGFFPLSILCYPYFFFTEHFSGRCFLIWMYTSTYLLLILLLYPRFPFLLLYFPFSFAVWYMLFFLRSVCPSYLLSFLFPSFFTNFIIFILYISDHSLLSISWFLYTSATLLAMPLPHVRPYSTFL